MEDANGRLYVLEISKSTIEWKIKEVDEYEKFKMGSSLQKGTRNNTTMSSDNGGLQNFKGNDNKRSNDDIGQTI